MPKKHSNFSGQEQFHPILVILVAGSLSLAIVDPTNRPAYFDIVKIAVVYFFAQPSPKKILITPTIEMI